MIIELRATIANLESLLQERDASLDRAASQMHKAAVLPHLTPEACRDILPDKWTKE